MKFINMFHTYWNEEMQYVMRFGDDNARDEIRAMRNDRHLLDNYTNEINRMAGSVPP